MGRDIAKWQSPEYAKMVELAKHEYMMGKSSEEIIETTGLNPITLKRYITVPRNNEKSWAVQRREFIKETIYEATELAKVNLSAATRKGASLLFKLLDSVEKDIDAGNLNSLEKAKLVETVSKAITNIHKMFIPNMRQPLVNISMQQNPGLPEGMIIEDLKAKGLYVEDANTEETGSAETP